MSLVPEKPFGMVRVYSLSLSENGVMMMKGSAGWRSMFFGVYVEVGEG